jgi:hypothetical protein
MDAGRKAFLLRAVKFAGTVFIGYFAASLVAGTVLNVLFGTMKHVQPMGFALLVALLALPFVAVLKIQMIVSGWDGAPHHAIAGALVGLAAGVLVGGAANPADIIVFTVAGLAGALTYLMTRNITRKAIRWSPGR